MALLQDTTQDIRIGVRMLRKEWRFTLAAVVALAVGFALTTSVFAIVNTALLRDLPYPQPEQLVLATFVGERGVDADHRPMSIAGRHTATLRARARIG